MVAIVKDGAVIEASNSFDDYYYAAYLVCSTQFAASVCVSSRQSCL